MLHFYKTPRILPLLTRALTWSIPTNKKELYLTFDDGPIPDLTHYVLDLLDLYNIKATFYCVGDNIRKYPHIATELVAKGHLIGNHTFNHLSGWRTSRLHYMENIQKCDEQITSVQPPQPVKLFRPPYGQLSWSLVHQLKTQYEIIMWDVLAYDFDQTHSADKSLKHIMHKTSRGSIILFHDNFKAEAKLKYMLPRFIEHYLQQGYAFKKLDLFEPLSKHN